MTVLNVVGNDPISDSIGIRISYNNITKNAQTNLTPAWLRIGGYWYPRGGMPIDVFWQSGAPPADLWLPDQGVAPYRGRG